MEQPLNIYLAMIIAGAGATYVWRGLGVLLADRLDTTSPILRCVELIAYGLIAALMARVVLFPIGPAGDIPMALRLAALIIGVGSALYFKWQPLYPVLVGMLVVVAGLMIL